MNINLSLLQRKKKLSLAVALILAVGLAACFFPKNSAKRRVCFYPLMGSEKLVSEVRYVHTPESSSDEQAFVDELLLGAQTPRTRPLFSQGTRALFCFLRNHTLYVHLSKEALLEQNDAAKIMEGIALFKKNIFHNFKSVKDIALYIDGRAVEEEAAGLDPELPVQLNEH